VSHKNVLGIKNHQSGDGMKFSGYVFNIKGERSDYWIVICHNKVCVFYLRGRLSEEPQRGWGEAVSNVTFLLSLASIAQLWAFASSYFLVP
jgi:hypothetical protein